MTKFILHGGFTRINNDINEKYYREITKDLPAESTVLVIPFSRDTKEYDDILQREKQKLVNSSKDKLLNVKLASEDNLIEEIEGSDALVIVGGDSLKLNNVLKQHHNFTDSIKDKTVAGSSAGAYVLSTCYHSADSGKIHEGLGILPLRVICHFKSGQFDVTEEAIAAIKEYSSDLELIILKDYEWKVFTK